VVGVRGIYRGSVVIALIAGVLALTQAPGAGAANGKCPAGVGADANAVQWVWGYLGKPTSADPSVNWTWTRANGTWDNGSASGTICSEVRGGGLGNRNIVAAVSGPSKLTPNSTKFGLPGIKLVLSLTVSSSNDSNCPVGTAASVRLFASYHGVHEDSASMQFAAACSTHDTSLSGSLLHVLIGRDGHQVTSLTG
jgi:hypothetical protein